MSWVCDECGYENEYSEDVQITTCLCCGEPASEFKIQKAYEDLIAFQKEVERKVRIEKIRQKRLLRQKRIDRIYESSKVVVKGIAIATFVLIVFATIWVGISMYSNGFSLSDWNKHMTTNMGKVAFASEIGFYRDNLSEIRVFENTKKSLSVSGKTLYRNLSQYSDAAKDNNKIIDGYNWSYLGERFPYLKKNIKNASTNFACNWKIFRNQAYNNIEQLIVAIKERVGR